MSNPDTTRIFNYPEVTTPASDAKILLDSQTVGSKCIDANLFRCDLIDKTITQRGTFEASEDDADGFKKVVVDIPYTDVHVASGPIATFEGEDLPLKSLTASIVPVQDLHGYDSPWAGGAGKNKLPLVLDDIKNIQSPATSQGSWSGNSYITNGVTFKINTDNDGNVTSILATGSTTSDNATLVLYGTNATSAKDIVFSQPFIVSDGAIGSESTFRGILWGTEGAFIDGEEVSFNAMTVYGFGIRIVAGYNLPSGGVMFYPMIRLASVTDATFAPYSNICPISGWSGVNVYNDGANLFNQEYPNIDSTTRKLILNVGDGLFRMTTTTPLFTSPGGGTVASNLFLQTGEGEATASTQDDGVWLGHDKVVASTNGKVCIKYRIFNNISAYNPENFETELTKHTTYTIPFTDGQGQSHECFGGTFDVVNGPLDENQFCYKVTSDTSITKSGNYFEINNVLPEDATANYQFKASFCKRTETSLAYMVDGEGRFVTDRRYLAVKLPYSTVEDVKTYLTSINAQIVYTLPTSTTLQQQPTSIKSLDGENNVFASTGDVDVEYQTVWVRPTE